MSADSTLPPEVDEDSLEARQLPHSLDAEQAVLGGILLSPEGFDMIEGRLQADDFFCRAYGYIFSAMEQLASAEKPMDILLLKENLEAAGHLEVAGGAKGLAELMDAVPTGAQVEHYAQIVREKAILRRLIGAATDIVQNASDRQSTASGVLDGAEHSIFEIAMRGTTKEAQPIQQVLKETWSKIELYQQQSRDGHGIVTGVPTDYFELDKLTSGLHEDELIIIAGRPSMGKSTFALNVMRRIAVDHGVPAVLYTLEMSADNVARNLLCAHAKIDAQRLRTGMLTNEEWAHLGKSTDALSQAPLFIDETPAISLSELRGKTRRLKARYDVGLCVIDYLQLMTASSTAQSRSREQEISEISRGLKALAKELKIPVISLSQLNRKSADRSDNRPILSDLRESGAIEQDADMVFLIHRPDYYDANDSPGQSEIIIAKQRNGPTGTVNLAFINTQLRFENLSVGGDGYEPSSDEEF